MEYNLNPTKTGFLITLFFFPAIRVKFFSQTTHTYTKEGIPMGLLLGGGGRKDQRTKTLCQFCASLIGTSWRLVTQHTTSVSASLIKIKVNK